MPYLDWGAETGIELVQEEIPRGLRLGLGLAPASLEKLIGAVEELFSDGQPGRELQLVLPKGWTLFWKLREGDSRLLLAHPERDAWVGTVSLNPVHAAPLLEGFARARAGEMFRVAELSELGAWSTISNFELVLQLKAD